MYCCPIKYLLSVGWGAKVKGASRICCSISVSKEEKSIIITIRMSVFLLHIK